MTSLILKHSRFISSFRIPVLLRHINTSSPQVNMPNLGPMITFNNGNKFPQFGLGTWQSANIGEIQTALRAALDAGYRHIDTAIAYGNEAGIGEVLQEYFKAGKLNREDIYITTKLWITYHQPERVPKCLENSLKALQLDYIDLYLIHTPCAFEETGFGVYPTKADGKTPAYLHILPEDTWKAMEKLVEAGKAKNIGVSNFNSKQVERICKIAKIKPVTNQVECHAYHNQHRLADFCQQRGITITSYGSLGSPGRPDRLKKEAEPVLLQDLVILKLSDKYQKTTGQICLRYLLEKGMLVIPKSVKPSRIIENSQIFDFKLTADEIKQVDGLDKGYKYFDMSVGIEHPHPEFPGLEPF